MGISVRSGVLQENLLEAIGEQSRQMDVLTWLEDIVKVCAKNATELHKLLLRNEHCAQNCTMLDKKRPAPKKADLP